MIVVDSNVLAYLYLPGEHTARAEAPLGREQEWQLPFFGAVSSGTSWLAT